MRRLLSINCNSLQLTSDTLPTPFPIYSKEIYLSENILTVIKRSTFQNLGALTILDLSNNNISVLSIGCFNDLKKLIKLEISANNINEIDMSSYNPNLFIHQDNLQNLDMSNNYHNNIAHRWTWYKVVPALASLETLSVDFTYDEAFGKGLNELKYLTDLRLGFDYNMHLTRQHFKYINCYSTKRLILTMRSALAISFTFEPGIFSVFPNLVVLGLQSFNLECLTNITFGLNDTRIARFAFTDSSSAGSHELKLLETHLKNLQNTSLRFLQLSNNLITNFEDKAFGFLTPVLGKNCIWTAWNDQDEMLSASGTYQMISYLYQQYNFTKIRKFLSRMFLEFDIEKNNK